MKRDRLENVTKEDKNELVNALDKLASNKQSKSHKSSGHLKSKRSSKKTRIRRRRIKDGDFEYEARKTRTANQTTQILIVLTNKS